MIILIVYKQFISFILCKKRENTRRFFEKFSLSMLNIPIFYFVNVLNLINMIDSTLKS